MRGSSGSNPTQLGGALMRKLVGLLASAAIVVAACGGTSTTPAPATTAPTAAPATEAPASAPASEAPASEAPAEAPDLFGTAYSPAPATPGGTIIIGDWQEATQFNPYYFTQVTEANVAATAWHTLLTISRRLQVHPAARRRADPDDRQRWRHRRPERRRDDRHLEAPRRPQVVRRRAPHLRRLQVRVGVGPRQGQHRRHHRRLGEHQGLRVRVRHGHDLALRRDLSRAT